MSFPPALPPERTWFPLVELAVGEDIGSGDATTPLVVEVGRQGSAIIEARQPLVVCGLEIAFAVFREIEASATDSKPSPETSWRPHGETCAASSPPNEQL